MAEKKKKGILSQIKAASQDTPTILTGPEPVVKDSQGKTIVDARVPKTMTRQMAEYEASKRPKIGALQNILKTRTSSGPFTGTISRFTRDENPLTGGKGKKRTYNTAISPLKSAGQPERGNILPAKLEGIVSNVLEDAKAYSKGYYKLQKKTGVKQDPKTGLYSETKIKPSQPSPAEYVLENLQKLMLKDEHEFKGGINQKTGERYPNVVVKGNKQIQKIGNFIAQRLMSKSVREKHGIFASPEHKKTIAKLAGEVVMTEDGQIVRHRQVVHETGDREKLKQVKLDGSSWTKATNIDDVNVADLMIEDTNYGNRIKGEEGGRAGQAEHFEEVKVSSMGDPHPRTQIPGNPKVPFKGVDMHLKPREARKLKAGEASSLSSVKPGDEPRVNVGHRILVKDKEGSVKKMIWRGTKKEIPGWGSYPTISAPKSLLTMPINALEDVGGPNKVVSGWDQQIERLQGGDAIVEASMDQETGLWVEKDTRTEIEESKYLSLDPQEKMDVADTEMKSQGDIYWENKKKKDDEIKTQAEKIRKSKGEQAAREFLVSELSAESIRDAEEWDQRGEGRSMGKKSSGGVYEAEGGYKPLTADQQKQLKEAKIRLEDPSLQTIRVVDKEQGMVRNIQTGKLEMAWSTRLETPLEVLKRTNPRNVEKEITKLKKSMQVYVRKGADTKYNPPSLTESLAKSQVHGAADNPFRNIQNMPPMFENIGQEGGMSKPVPTHSNQLSARISMHQEVIPIGTAEPAKGTDKPVRTDAEKQADWVEEGKKKVAQQKANQTAVARKEIKPLKKTTNPTLLTSSSPMPGYHEWGENVGPEPERISHTQRKEGQPTVVSKKRKPKADDPNISGVQVEKELTGTFEERQKRLNPSMKPKVIWTAGMPYLGLGIDIIQGLRVMKDSKKSGKEFNLGSFIPAWAKKIAYGESIPRS